MTSTTQYADIFRALAAPFPKVKERDGSRGAKLKYITARQAANRLDEVLGPENWEPEFYEVCDVLFCRLTITLPDGRKVSKSDAGGFKEMMERGKVDEENTDKTGPSDAFKRAASMFGVARYLYNDGTADLGKAPAAEAPPKTEPAPAAKGQGKRAGMIEWAQDAVAKANQWYAKENKSHKGKLCQNEWQLINHLGKWFDAENQDNIVIAGSKPGEIAKYLEGLDPEWKKDIKAEAEDYLYGQLPARLAVPEGREIGQDE